MAVNGTTVIYSQGGTPVALLRNTTLNIGQDLPDATTKNSGGFADHINGVRDYSIDVDGLVSFVATTGNADILSAMILNRTNVAFKFAPSTQGQVQYTGTVSLASLTIATPSEDVCTITGTLTGKGALVRGTVS
jgi:predicted secreted protein